MKLSRRMLLMATITCSGALASSPALAASSSTPSSTSPTTIKARALLKSRELWATIDVCSPTDQPNTVGIRGSMPGDAHTGDKLFMAFRLQYLNPAGVWVDLVPSAKPSYVSVGGATTVREGGSSFQLVPVAGKPASTLRGVVDFQWRRGKKILLSASRPTGAGHKSVSGADPAGYSAASCLIG